MRNQQRVQWCQCCTHYIGGVGRRPVVHESVDDVLVAHEGRHVDGCQARLQTHKHCYLGRRGDAEAKRREQETRRKSRTSVTAWMDAPCLSRSSITFALFFLQAMWSGVKPFCAHRHTRTHTNTGRKSQERQQLGGRASCSYLGFVTGTSAFNRRVKGKRMIWQEMEGWSRGTSSTDHKGKCSLFTQSLLSKWSFFFMIILLLPRP